MPEFEYAVIIPAWNEAEYIQRCIDSVQSAMSGVESAGQLIVVDNNSSDNTGQLASNAGAQVVFEPINQISRARNAGAQAADASIYFFVDADSQINTALLQTAVLAIVQDNRVGGGASIRADRVVGWSIGLTINSWNWISRQFKIAAGCFVYCRADAFHAVGGFSLTHYAGEELYFSRALRRWGRDHSMSFHIITEHTIDTSMRKTDWYSPSRLFFQMLITLVPGALKSKRMMKTWYDDSAQRTRKDE